MISTSQLRVQSCAGEEKRQLWDIMVHKTDKVLDLIELTA